jgi:hypothetical protein
VCDGECIDISQDRANCGDCGHTCGDGEGCFQGECAIGPCDGLCSSFTEITTSGFQSGNVGTAARCYQLVNEQVSGEPTQFNCGNVNDGGVLRVFEINGEPVTCNWNNTVLPAERGGGWCFSWAAGRPDFAAFALF